MSPKVTKVVCSSSLSVVFCTVLTTPNRDGERKGPAERTYYDISIKERDKNNNSKISDEYNSIQLSINNMDQKIK